MKLLMPLEELEARQKLAEKNRREPGRFWNANDTAFVLLAAAVLLLGALLLFAPLRQRDYQEIGSFSLQQETALLNINTASEQELCSLPGIGEKKAARIRAYIQENGPFENLQQAAQVPGISEAMIEKWQGLAVAE